MIVRSLEVNNLFGDLTESRSAEVTKEVFAFINNVFLFKGSNLDEHSQLTLTHYSQIASFSLLPSTFVLASDLPTLLFPAKSPHSFPASRFEAACVSRGSRGKIAEAPERNVTA